MEGETDLKKNLLDEEDLGDKAKQEMLEERREGGRGRRVPESNFRVGSFPRKRENTEKVETTI